MGFLSPGRSCPTTDKREGKGLLNPEGGRQTGYDRGGWIRDKREFTTYKVSEL